MCARLTRLAVVVRVRSFTSNNTTSRRDSALRYVALRSVTHAPVEIRARDSKHYAWCCRPAVQERSAVAVGAGSRSGETSSFDHVGARCEKARKVGTDVWSHPRRRHELLGSANAHSMPVAQIRSLSDLSLVLGGVLVALSLRGLVARRLDRSRWFVSRRVVDRDAREEQARGRWDDDGGAMVRAD